MARQAGRLSIARYIMKTQPSCEAAWYTVKILVAAEIGIELLWAINSWMWWPTYRTHQSRWSPWCTWTARVSNTSSPRDTGSPTRDPSSRMYRVSLGCWSLCDVDLSYLERSGSWVRRRIEHLVDRTATWRTGRTASRCRFAGSSVCTDRWLYSIYTLYRYIHLYEHCVVWLWLTWKFDLSAPLAWRTSGRRAGSESWWAVVVLEK